MGSSRVLVGKEIDAYVELAVAGEIGEGERRVIVDNVKGHGDNSKGNTY